MFLTRSYYIRHREFIINFSLKCAYCPVVIYKNSGCFEVEVETPYCGMSVTTRVISWKVGNTSYVVFSPLARNPSLVSHTTLGQQISEA